MTLRHGCASNQSSQDSLHRLRGEFYSSPKFTQHACRQQNFAQSSRQFNIQEAEELASETTSMFESVNRIEREIQDNMRNSSKKFMMMGPFPSHPTGSDPSSRRNITKNFYKNMPSSSLNLTHK